MNIEFLPFNHLSEEDCERSRTLLARCFASLNEEEVKVPVKKDCKIIELTNADIDRNLVIQNMEKIEQIIIEEKKRLRKAA